MVRVTQSSYIHPIPQPPQHQDILFLVLAVLDYIPKADTTSKMNEQAVIKGRRQRSYPDSGLTLSSSFSNCWYSDSGDQAAIDSISVPVQVPFPVPSSPSPPLSTYFPRSSYVSLLPLS